MEISLNSKYGKRLQPFTQKEQATHKEKNYLCPILICRKEEGDGRLRGREGITERSVVRPEVLAERKGSVDSQGSGELSFSFTT